MQRFRSLLGAAGLVVAMASCSPVYVDEPIGAEPADLDAEEWAGSWVGEDSPAFLVRPAAEPGSLWVGGFEHGSGEPEAMTVVAHFRDAGRRNEHRRWLVSARLDEGGGYLWALVVRDGDTAVFYAPDADAFRELVAQGELPGRFEESEWGVTVHLHDLQPHHVEMILGDLRHRLFRWEEPEVMRRVSH